jgi:hypothetical protein
MYNIELKKVVHGMHRGFIITNREREKAMLSGAPLNDLIKFFFVK